MDESAFADELMFGGNHARKDLCKPLRIGDQHLVQLFQFGISIPREMDHSTHIVKEVAWGWRMRDDWLLWISSCMFFHPLFDLDIKQRHLFSHGGSSASMSTDLFDEFGNPFPRLAADRMNSKDVWESMEEAFLQMSNHLLLVFRCFLVSMCGNKDDRFSIRSRFD